MILTQTYACVSVSFKSSAPCLFDFTLCLSRNVSIYNQTQNCWLLLRCHGLAIPWFIAPFPLWWGLCLNTLLSHTMQPNILTETSRSVQIFLGMEVDWLHWWSLRTLLNWSPKGGAFTSAFNIALSAHSQSGPGTAHGWWGRQPSHAVLRSYKGEVQEPGDSGTGIRGKGQSRLSEEVTPRQKPQLLSSSLTGGGASEKGCSR